MNDMATMHNYFLEKSLSMASNIDKSHHSIVSNLYRHTEDQKMKQLNAVWALGYYSC